MQTADKFDQELLTKIKQAGLEPKARWRFLLANYAVWLVGSLALLLGAATVSMLIYLYAANQPLRVSNLGELLLVTVPLFWLLCLGLFIWLVCLNFKHTKRGYRYPVWLVLAATVAASLLLGIGLHGWGLSGRLDDLLVRRAPRYYSLVNPGLRFWSEPERGRLSGMIVVQVAEGEFLVESIDRREWLLAAEGAKMAPAAELRVGRPVRALGKLVDNNRFEAGEILPVVSGREMFKRLGPALRPPLPTGEEDNLRRGAPNRHQLDQRLKEMFERYPEVKTSFEQDLLANRQELQGRRGDEQLLWQSLAAMGISEETIKQLQAAR
jgi:hypothetical protein